MYLVLVYSGGITKKIIISDLSNMLLNNIEALSAHSHKTYFQRKKNNSNKTQSTDCGIVSCDHTAVCKR